MRRVPEQIAWRLIAKLRAAERFENENGRQLSELMSLVLDLQDQLNEDLDGRILETIKVWRFGDAPAEYKLFSPHGGDEDWVAFVPLSMLDTWIPWMEEGTPFGCCSVSKHPVRGGEVRIGAHA